MGSSGYSEVFQTFQLPTLNFNSENGPEGDKDVLLKTVQLYEPKNTSPLNYLKKLATSFSEEKSYEAFYVCDLSATIAQVARWRSHLPRVRPFYAVKCNDDPVLLRVLAELGVGFDCASRAEIARVLSLGVSTDRMIFANPVKQISMLKYARDSRVQMLTCDNRDELLKIHEHFPEAKVILRIVPPAVQVQCVLGNKFGAQEAECARLIKTARALGVELVGISFHVGSGCREARGFALAVAAARRVWDMMIAAGYTPNLLDIGGGFPGADPPAAHETHNFANAHLPGHSDGDGISFEEIVAAITPALDDYFPAEKDLMIIAEPGRYVASRAYTLCCNVIGRREVGGSTDASEENDSGTLSETELFEMEMTSSTTSRPAQEMVYFINDGVYGSFNCLLYDHAVIEPHYVNPRLESTTERNRLPTTVYGPTCDGLDVLLRAYPMPRLQMGDWVYFENMGAYTLAAASEFNGMPRPQVNYLLAHDHFDVFEPLLASYNFYTGVREDPCAQLPLSEALVLTESQDNVERIPELMYTADPEAYVVTRRDSDTTESCSGYLSSSPDMSLCYESETVCV